MLILVTLLAKYVIIIRYEMFRGLSLSKVALKSKFPAKLGGAFPDCNKAFVIDSDAQIFMYLIHCIHVTLLY